MAPTAYVIFAGLNALRADMYNWSDLPETYRRRYGNYQRADWPNEIIAPIVSAMVDRAVAPPLPDAIICTEVWSGKWFIERSRALFGASLWLVWRTQLAAGTQIAVEYFVR